MNCPMPGAEETAASPRTLAHPADQPPEQQESDRSRISYVYVIGRTGTALEASASQLTGLRDGPLRTVTSGRLTALVSSVPADAFSAEGMKAQLEDLTQLEAIARTHHAVVEAACAGAMVLPMRLATVYLDDARVRSMLDERGTEFDALLSRLEGHAEVGVKVYADARAAAAAEAPAAATGASGSPAPGSPAPAASAVSPGRAYLQQAGPTCSSGGPNGVRIVMPTARREPSPPMCGSGWPTWHGTWSRTARSKVSWRPVPARTSPTRRIWSPRTASGSSTGP